MHRLAAKFLTLGHRRLDPMHSSEPHTRTVSSTLSVIVEAPREAVFKWFVPVALPDILLGYGPLPAASAVIGQNPSRYILVEEGAQ